MQFERDRSRSTIAARRGAERGVVDGFVIDDRDLWVVVARQGERIDEWMHGSSGEEVAPLRVCRGFLGKDRVVLDQPDPQRDRLLSEFESSW